MLIVTTNDVPGYKISKVLGPVYGTSVRSRNFFGNVFGSFRSLFGGKQAGFIRMISQTRDHALDSLSENANRIGANAVVAMRFDSGEFGTGNGMTMNEVTAYGTAVIISEA